MTADLRALASQRERAERISVVLRDLGAQVAAHDVAVALGVAGYVLTAGAPPVCAALKERPG